MEKLYDRHGEALYRFLSVKLGSLDDAQDVLQLVFCRLLLYPLRWKLARNPRAYLFRIARNEANRFLRKRRRSEIPLPAAEAVASAFGESFAGPDEASTRFVSAALAGLPEEQREVIILKVFQGLTFREIGRVCGESQNTAASRYRYGLDKLRQALEEKP